MMRPLAMIFYENLLPGSQLVNRLHDLGYRVQVVLEPKSLMEQAKTLHPLVVLIDLASRNADICELISELKRTSDTAHIPVIAYAGRKNKKLQRAARIAGTSIIAQQDAILAQLPHLLEQALAVD